MKTFLCTLFYKGESKKLKYLVEAKDNFKATVLAVDEIFNNGIDPNEVNLLIKKL